MGISVINASGIPPFMLLGYANEQDLIRTWEEKYFRARIFTSGTSNVDAMRAYGVTRMLGVTYFSGDINTIFAKYFDDAGFECLDMAHMEGIPFDKVPELPAPRSTTSPCRRSAGSIPARKASICWARPGIRSTSSSN